MTERKPAGLSFTSWIDQQIQEAAERGAFDDLPGAGKPLPKRDTADEADAAQAWLRDYLRREGVSTAELLPTPLRLRKEAEDLAESVSGLDTEQQVRDAVSDLNQRIMRWRRIPLGSPIFVPLVDEAQLVRRWREARAAAAWPGSAEHPTARPDEGQPEAGQRAAGPGPPGGRTPARPAASRRRFLRRPGRWLRGLRGLRGRRSQR